MFFINILILISVLYLPSIKMVMLNIGAANISLTMFFFIYIYTLVATKRSLTCLLVMLRHSKHLVKDRESLQSCQK